MEDPIVGSTDIKHCDIVAVKWQFWMQADLFLPQSDDISCFFSDFSWRQGLMDLITIT